MSWLATDAPLRTLADALALRPELLDGYRAFDAAVAADPSLDRALVARCRARVATLLGVGSPDAPAADADDAVVELVEQLVLDPHGVTDALVARAGAVLSTPSLVALAQAVAVWESACRVARCLGVAAEL